MATSDVIVIGSGAVGLSCAYALARKGADVHLIDSAGIAGGASRSNAGWVVPSMSEPVPSPAALKTAANYAFKSDGPLKIGLGRLSPSYIGFLAQMLSSCRRSVFSNGLAATAALSRTAISEFDTMQRDGVEFERHDQGILQLFLKEATLAGHTEDVKAMESLGLAPAQLLTASEVQSLEPAVGKQVIGGILHPHDQFIDPSSFVEGLALRCQQLGVRISTHEAVCEILPKNQGVIHVGTMQSGIHKSSSVVLAAGSQTGELLRRLGTKLPLQAGKGYGFDITHPPIKLKRAIYLSDHKVAVTPLNSSMRLAGTMEFGSSDLSVDERRASGILRSAPHYFDSWNLQKTPVAWAGLRPMTPDGLPMIGRVRGHKNVFVAAGHAMLGITLGPVTGALLSTLILSGEKRPELAPFSPDRFLPALLQS